jgi:LmbE family N-acetylglucosaminyl deacetylase
MIGIRQLLEYFSFRRLRLRAGQIADYALDANATVYPHRLEFDGPSQRILVLTPHADDETFGAGGVLLRHISRGDEVHVSLFSDNVASIDGEEMDAEEKRRLRAAEFETAMDTLGISSFEQLGIGNSAFRHNVYPESVFTRLIEKEPDVLYLPSLFDNHHDHRILNIWLMRALREQTAVRPLIRGFEVWSPLPATAVTDITPFFEQKRAAMRCYASQQETIDYLHHIEGLNAYRAMTFGEKKIRYAETFLELSAVAYLELGKSSLL